MDFPQFSNPQKRTLDFPTQKFEPRFWNSNPQKKNPPIFPSRFLNSAPQKKFPLKLNSELFIKKRSEGFLRIYKLGKFEFFRLWIGFPF